MTVTTRGPERRRRDRGPPGASTCAVELAGVSLADLRAGRRRPATRDIVRRLARPGPGPDRRGQARLARPPARSSPPGRIPWPGPGRMPPAGRPRSRSCASGTGSADRSTDLSAVRAAVSVPVLAKEFVVDDGELPQLRRPAPTWSCCSPASHPAARLARLVETALGLGLEPLVEAHDERELERALATRARLIGLNNRDLRTLAVDPEQAVRLRELVPGDRLVVAEIRACVTRRGRRLAGARLRCRTGRRGPDARRRPGVGGAAASSAAGQLPDDLAGRRSRPVREDLRGDRRGRGARGRRRGCRCDRPQSRARARPVRSPWPRPSSWPARPVRRARPAARIVAITAIAGSERLAEIIAGLRSRRRPAAGDEGADLSPGLDRPTWKSLRLPAVAGATGARGGRRSSPGARPTSTPGAERILLDTAGGPAPGGTGGALVGRRWPRPSPGRCRSSWPAA